MLLSMLTCNKMTDQKPYKASHKGILKPALEAIFKGFDEDLMMKAMKDLAIVITKLIRSNGHGSAEKIEWRARDLLGPEMFQPYMDEAFENARLEGGYPFEK